MSGRRNRRHLSKCCLERSMLCLSPTAADETTSTLAIEGYCQTFFSATLAIYKRTHGSRAYAVVIGYWHRWDSLVQCWKGQDLLVPKQTNWVRPSISFDNTNKFNYDLTLVDQAQASLAMARWVPLWIVEKSLAVTNNWTVRQETAPVCRCVPSRRRSAEDWTCIVGKYTDSSDDVDHGQWPDFV